MAARKLSPRSSAFLAPTPLTASSAPSDVGWSRAISRSVASWKMTYGGTPRDRAISRRTARSRSNRRAIDVLPRFGLGARLHARLVLARRPLARQRQAGEARLVLQQRQPPRRQRQHRVGIVGLLQQADANQLLDVAADLGDRRLRQEAERAQLVVAAGDDLLARVSAQDAGDVRGAEPLADARDARQDLARDDDGSAAGFQLVEAVVARAAALLRVAIAEVLRQVPMAAADARGVALHLPQQVLVRLGQLAVPLEHDAPLHEVRRRRDEQALGLEAVAAGAPGFLLIVLERSRRAGMHDEPHVRAVDAHAEGDRRDDHVDALAQERVLVRAALRVGQAGVIRKRRNADACQPRRRARRPPCATCSR